MDEAPRAAYMPAMRSSALRFGHLAASALAVATFAACGGDLDQSSPRGVATALASAMDRGDADRAMSLLAPVDKVRESFDCGPGDALARALDRAREDMRASFEELRQTGVRVHLARFDEKGSEEKALGPGESWRECATRGGVEVHRARLTLVYRKGGRDDEDGERWEFVRLPGDERWWFLPR